MPGSHNLLPGQISPPEPMFETLRQNAEHYVACSALNVIYYDTISCMYQHIQAKMHQMCVISEQTAII